MLSNILSRHEGKITEFKENTLSMPSIVKTVIAFANTAGGSIVIGVEDKTKKIVGVTNILHEEERLASVITDSIEPMLQVDIDIVNHDKHELLLIHVPYMRGPYYLKKKGLNKGAYIRMGSTNRLADSHSLANLLRISDSISFDESPCFKADMDDLDHALIVKKLAPIYKQLSKKNYPSLGLTFTHQKKKFPTYGALLLFPVDKSALLPDSTIHCACFASNTREHILDHKDITSGLLDAVDETIHFIERHTNIAAKIHRKEREDILQFPPTAVREAVINAIIHCDYAMPGSTIQIAVFSNRIEITNPGGLPFGQSMESALSGVSRARNRLIVKIFRELRLVERLGSGIPRIFESYKNNAIQAPEFAELGNHFRVTLYEASGIKTQQAWQLELMSHLADEQTLGTKDIAALWGVTARTTRERLKEMTQKGLLERMATSKTDPTASYRLKKSPYS